MNTFREKVRGFIDTVKSSKKLSVIAIILLVAAIPLTVFIAQQAQDVRQRASTNQATLTVDPTTTQPGNTITVKWNITPPTGTPTPTAVAACTPRPNIVRNVTVDNVNKIVNVTATVGTNASKPNNTLKSIKFTRISNATLEVPTNWTLTNPGNETPIYTFPANTTTVSFKEKRIACGAVTVDYTWIDDCGEFKDFSGAGTGATGLTCDTTPPTNTPTPTPIGSITLNTNPNSVQRGGSIVVAWTYQNRTPHPNDLLETFTANGEHVGYYYLSSCTGTPGTSSPVSGQCTINTGGYGPATYTVKVFRHDDRPTPLNQTTFAVTPNTSPPPPPTVLPLAVTCVNQSQVGSYVFHLIWPVSEYGIVGAQVSTSESFPANATWTSTTMQPNGTNMIIKGPGSFTDFQTAFRVNTRYYARLLRDGGNGNGNIPGTDMFFSVSSCGGASIPQKNEFPKLSVDLISKAYAQTNTTLITGAETLQLFRLSKAGIFTVVAPQPIAVGENVYLNCHQATISTGPPTAPIYSGQCEYPIPSFAEPGTYVIRMMATDQTTVLGESPVITVAPYLSAGLTSYWTLDETEGNIAYDSVVHESNSPLTDAMYSNNGTVFDGTIVDGKIKKARQFSATTSATSNYIELFKPPYAEEFTVSAWVYASSAASFGEKNYASIFNVRNKKNVGGMNLELEGDAGYANGEMHCDVWVKRADTGAVVVQRSISQKGQGIKAGEWNHVACSYNKEGRVKIYINGKVTNTTNDPLGTPADKGTVNNPTSNTFVGFCSSDNNCPAGYTCPVREAPCPTGMACDTACQPTASTSATFAYIGKNIITNQSFGGIIDEVGWWNRPLLDSEVAELAKGTRPDFPKRPKPTPPVKGVGVSAKLTGIGTPSGNVNPKHPTRPILITLIDKDNITVGVRQGTIAYDSVTGLFKGPIRMGDLCPPNTPCDTIPNVIIGGDGFVAPTGGVGGVVDTPVYLTMVPAAIQKGIQTQVDFRYSYSKPGPNDVFSVYKENPLSTPGITTDAVAIPAFTPDSDKAARVINFYASTCLATPNNQTRDSGRCNINTTNLQPGRYSVRLFANNGFTDRLALTEFIIIDPSKNPKPDACAQVVTKACKVDQVICAKAPCPPKEICVDFPTPCDVPPGWYTVSTDGRKPLPPVCPRIIMNFCANDDVPEPQISNGCAVFQCRKPKKFPEGSYTVKIWTPQFLRKQVPGIVTVKPNEPLILPELVLQTGDINEDNLINILDFNLLNSCYGDKISSENCKISPHYSDDIGPLADLNDDGVVDGVDYNLFIRSLATKEGD